MKLSQEYNQQEYNKQLKLMKKLRQTHSVFLKFSEQTQNWESVPQFCACQPYTLQKPNYTLTTLSYNVLFDRIPQQKAKIKGNMQKILCSQQRYFYILKQIQEINPHIAGLQEVTYRFYNMLLQCEWVRQKYWVSDLKSYQNGWGNILITRIQPIHIQSIKIESLPRIICTGFFALRQKNNDKVSIISVSSVHLIALEKNHELRVQQLNSLAKKLKHYEQVVQQNIIQGDMNFHQEFQTKSAQIHKLKDCWLQKYDNNLKIYPGYTFDASINNMINQMYWGFERRRMRLDRVFYLANTLQVQDMKIVFDSPIHGNKKQVDNYIFLKGGLMYLTDYFGLNIRGNTKQDYMFGSDHFGLLTYFKLKTHNQKRVKLNV